MLNNLFGDMSMRVLRFGVTAFLSGVFVLLSGCLEDPTDPTAQFNADVAAIDDYVQARGLTAYKDKSGIRFEIQQLGTGFSPNLNQEVRVKYQGMIIPSDEIFAATATIRGYVNGFIPGWQQALILMPAGTKATVCIPSGLAYGPNGYGGIPGNTNLRFDIELLEVIRTAAEQTQATKDVAAIDTYLNERSIAAVQDTTGIRYVITQEGSGPSPTWFDKVRFKAIGRVMATDIQFFDGTNEPDSNFDSRVTDYILGMKVALMKLKVGGRGTFYIPSGFAYGTADFTSNGIPPNSNLTYEVELMEIVD